MKVTVLTRWVEGERSRAPGILDIPGAWTDVTGQPDSQLPPDINAVVWEGDIDAAGLAALQARSDLAILSVDNTDASGNVISGGSLPASANPTAQQRTALIQYLNDLGVTGEDRAALIQANKSRRELKDAIVAWAKERPKKAT